MFNVNSGYVGGSRSVRSQAAVESYEVPTSMINKSLIEDFLSEFKEDFSKEELAYLEKVAVLKWKYVANERVSATSWHHTSSFFNKTDHYSLSKIADKLIEIKETLDEAYKAYKEFQKKEVAEVKYGVIKVQVWGGTKKRPKIEGYDEVAGIIVGDWLFYKNGHCVNGSISKYKINANKVEWLKVYSSYADLAKNHEAYKSTKKIFNKLIEEKGN